MDEQYRLINTEDRTLWVSWDGERFRVADAPEDEDVDFEVWFTPNEILKLAKIVRKELKDNA